MAFHINLFVLVLCMCYILPVSLASALPAPKTGFGQLTGEEDHNDEVEIFHRPIDLPDAGPVARHKERARGTPQKVSATSTIRLVGGAGPMEGRVEVLKDGQWGTVCDAFWDYNDAEVACRQLGIGLDGDVAAWPHNAKFGQGSGPILLSQLDCTGTETSLDQCGTLSHGVTCTHGDDAGVVCKQDYYTADGDIRLVGGDGPHSGILQIFYNTVWGMVCDDNWNFNNGHVVCRQLGVGALRQYSRPYNGQTNVVWLDEVNCIGTENRLEECSHLAWGSHNCNPGYEAVSILCNEQ